MAPTSRFAARETAFPILRQAVRLELKPETLPPSAGFRYAAPDETLGPLRQVEEPQRVRDAPIRRACHDSAGYPGLALRHGPATRRIRQTANPRLGLQPPPGTEQENTCLFQGAQAIPAGG